MTRFAIAYIVIATAHGIPVITTHVPAIAGIPTVKTNVDVEDINFIWFGKFGIVDMKVYTPKKEIIKTSRPNSVETVVT